MTLTEDQWVLLSTVITSLVVGYLVWRVAVVWRKVRADPLPPEVRERSHAVANEAAVVSAGLRFLKNKEDPLAELVQGLKRHDEGKRLEAEKKLT